MSFIEELKREIRENNLNIEIMDVPPEKQPTKESLQELNERIQMGIEKNRYKATMSWIEANKYPCK